jgi:radical SAM superfamily enzyme YgiQ (UPF0313 family)
MQPKRRVTLVRPPVVRTMSSSATTEGVPPLGLAYLAGVLDRARYPVSVVDAFGAAPERSTAIRGGRYLVRGLTAAEIAARIPADTAALGVSCMFSNEWLYAREVIAELRRSRPDVPIIAGGEHVSADPEYVLRSSPGVDVCVLGEGEETLLEVLEALREDTPLANVDGIAFRGPGGETVRTRPRARIRDIDAIPWPNWDSIPLETYLANGLGNDEVNRRSMPMLASRGCPYACTFCSNEYMYGRLWRARDPADLRREIETYIERYRIEHVELFDLTAIVDRRWIMAFTELLLRRPLPVTWAMPSGTRSEALDRDVLVRLEATGCRSLNYAPESGSPTTLTRIQKRVDLPTMLGSMRTAVKQGISVRANMIVGFPDEAPREILESVRFVLRMMAAGVHDVLIFPFVAYPGTRLYEQLVDAGRIDPFAPDHDEFLAAQIYNDVHQVVSWNPAFSGRTIKWVSVGGMALFYALQFATRPARLVRTMRSLLAGRPRTAFERLAAAKIRLRRVRAGLARQDATGYDAAARVAPATELQLTSEAQHR